MRKNFSIEMALNGVIVRDLEENTVMAFEKSSPEEDLADNDKVCQHLGRLILGGMYEEMSAPHKGFKPVGAGFTVDFKAFGRIRCEAQD